MATTKIFPIASTEGKALAYIADPAKTENGTLIYASECSSDPYQASRDFEAIRKARGTGKSRVLSQHIVQSFAPGEITPEDAIEIGKQLADKLLHGEYQYFLAVHTDKGHVHLHCIFNNVNMYDGRTFETHENRKSDPSCKKLLNASDELCRENGLSVIADHRSTKGKSHYEWEMCRINMSWKAKLKYAIDQVVKVSDDFEDFLKKCADFGILVDYNPDHKIDLKFMLREQKENNPRAKMTRTKTLGWFYETKQIIRRIENYKDIMSYTPRTKIIKTTSEKFVEAPALTRWADRANMKEVSRALNALSVKKMSLEEATQAAHTAFRRKIELTDDLNHISDQLHDLEEQMKYAKICADYKFYVDTAKSLNDKAKRKYVDANLYEIEEYNKARKKLRQWYPSGPVPTFDMMTQKKNALLQERSQKNQEYSVASRDSKKYAEAVQSIEEYQRNEQLRDEQRRKRKKDGDLE